MLLRGTVKPPHVDSGASLFCRLVPEHRDRWLPLMLAIDQLIAHCRAHQTFSSYTVHKIERSIDRDTLVSWEREGGLWFPSFELKSRVATSILGSQILKGVMVENDARWFRSPVFSSLGEMKSRTRGRPSGIWMSRVLFSPVAGSTIRATENGCSLEGIIGGDMASLLGLQFPALSEAILATGAALFSEGVRLPGKHVPFLATDASSSQLAMEVQHESAILPPNAIVPWIVERRLVVSLRSFV